MTITDDSAGCERFLATMVPWYHAVIWNPIQALLVNTLATEALYWFSNWPKMNGRFYIILIFWLFRELSICANLLFLQQATGAALVTTDDGAARCKHSFWP